MKCPVWLEQINEDYDHFVRHSIPVGNDHGVISLSETPDNLLMWSHYASQHKGIVVEFEVDEKYPFRIFENPANDLDSGHNIKLFERVRYRKKRHYLDSSLQQLDIDTVRHFYLVKSDEWLYEKEHRFILPLLMGDTISDSDGITLSSDLDDESRIWDLMRSKAQNRMYFLSVAPSRITRIILGAIPAQLEDAGFKI